MSAFHEKFQGTTANKSSNLEPSYLIQMLPCQSACWSSTTGITLFSVGCASQTESICQYMLWLSDSPWSHVVSSDHDTW